MQWSTIARSWVCEGRCADGRVRALLPAHRYYNDGADAATARGFVGEPTGLWYLGTGDRSPELLDEWLATMLEHARNGLRIAAAEPEETWLHSEGRDGLYADEVCRIVQSREPV